MAANRLPLVLLLLGCGAGGSAGQAESLLARGRATEAVAAYRDHAARHGDDDATLRAMATTTLALALKAEAAAVQIAAIRAVERSEIEALAVDVTLLIGSDDERVSAAAAVAVLRAHPDAPFVCTERLSSDDAEARATCAEGIGRKIGAAAHGELAPLMTDAEPGVRRAAVVAIGRMKRVDDTGVIVRLATADPDDRVRAAALRALVGRPGGEPAAAASVGLTGRPADRHLGVRLAAIEVLAALDRRADLARVVAGRDLPLALAAAAALHRRTGVASPALLDRALGDPSWTVRAGALNSATQLAPAGALAAIAGRAIADPAIEVRLAAARLLARIGLHERAEVELRRALAHRDPAVRLDAAGELARTGDRAGLDVLSSLAGDRDAAVRSAALAAHQTARRVSPGLVAALADPDPLLRIDAAELLLDLLD